jgi:hypothetical protein
LPAQRITEGETHWFMGYAAAAPAEMVALRQTEALKLVFRKEDILEVRRHGDRFLVRLRDSANMLVSFEQVVKAAPTCVCGDGRNGVIKQTNSPWSPDVIIINVGSCAFRFECFTWIVPVYGPMTVCIPTGFWCTQERTTNAQPS